MNKFNRLLALSGLVLTVAGCTQDLTIKMKKETAPGAIVEDPNYSVTRVAVFKDDLAYNDTRGIYEIVNNKTGEKYFGISGLGICAVGSHNSGKHSVTEDER